MANHWFFPYLAYLVVVIVVLDITQGKTEVITLPSRTWYRNSQLALFVKQKHRFAPLMTLVPCSIELLPMIYKDYHFILRNYLVVKTWRLQLIGMLPRHMMCILLSATQKKERKKEVMK